MGFLKRAINNLTIATPPPQGVAMSRIATIDITSAVPSVTFSNLNGNSDGMYWLIANSITLGTQAYFVASFNGDTNYAHYITLSTENNSGTGASSKYNSYIGITVVSGSVIYQSGTPFSIFLNYYIFARALPTTGVVSMVGMYGAKNADIFGGSMYGHWFQSGQTNLTSITLQFSGSSGNITAGHVELWAPRTV